MCIYIYIKIIYYYYCYYYEYMMINKKHLVFLFFQLLLPLCIHLASANGRDMDHQSASICYQYRRLSKCFTSKRSASQSARHRLKPIVRNVMQNTHHHTHTNMHCTEFCSCQHMSTWHKGMQRYREYHALSSALRTSSYEGSAGCCIRTGNAKWTFINCI